MIIKNFFLRLLIFFIRENQSKNLVRFGHNNLLQKGQKPEMEQKLRIKSYYQWKLMNTNISCI